MTARATVEPRCCWTDEHTLAHSAGFDVVAGDRHLGYVEEVSLSPADAVEALVVRAPGKRFELPAAAVVGIDAHAELLRVELRPV